jgi:hypothetical protein
MASLLPYTGKEFLDSRHDGREVWIYGERVNNIPAPGLPQYGADDRAALRRAASGPCGEEKSAYLPDRMGRVAPRSSEDWSPAAT